MLSAQHMVHIDVISSTRGPHWCYQLNTWSTLMLSAKHMVHAEIISSTHGPHWCYQLNTWSTLMLSAQHMVRTYVISSKHGPNWCNQLNTWSMLMLSAQHMVQTDVISSTHGPHWCHHDQQCCCNSTYGFLLLHCQKVCKAKSLVFYLRFLFRKLRVSAIEWYCIDLVYMGLLMDISIYSSLGDWLLAYVFMFTQSLFAQNQYINIFFIK
jgi:hypothetical protein